jgi:thiol:disulfide interchange protein DsbG
MKKIIKTLAFGLITISMSSVALDKIPAVSQLDNMPTSIKIAQQNGIKVIKHFTVDSGLDGWLVKNKKGYNIWFSDKVGYVFVGAYLDPAGNNLTAKYLEELAPKPDYNGTLARSTYVSTSPDSPSKRPMYVFYEPHCGYCSAFHAAVQPYIDNGAEVRWIPVAFLRPQAKDGKPSSYELVAKILKSSDPLAIIDAHENSKSTNGGAGGLLEGTPADAEIFKIAEENSSVMNELGFSGTPAIAYVDAKGETKLIKGFPKLAQLPTLFGMTRLDSSDGRLGRFEANPVKYPVK